jgi:dihydrofolate reductase
MSSIDTIFLGRRAYEKWASFWPGLEHSAEANEWMQGFSRFSNRAEKVVFSKSLPTAEWANSRIVRGSVENEVARLRKSPGGNMAVGGGPRLLQSFLAADLVDELFLAVSPSLVGHGKTMFRLWPDPDSPRDRVPVGVPDRHDFRTVEARKLSGGEILIHLERVGERA